MLRSIDYLIKTVFCITHLMPKTDVSKSSYPAYCSTGNIDMVSTEGFLHSKRKGLLQNTVDYEEYALARLAFYENSLIGQEISVRFPH